MTNKEEKKKVEIQLGSSFWIGISFAGGVFGFGWEPFIIIFVSWSLIAVLSIASSKD